MKISSMFQFLLLGVLHLTGFISCRNALKTPAREELKTVFELPLALTESSGMIALEDGLYLGHNDSGNKPVLYLYNDQRKVLRTIKVKDVMNNDWEDLAADENFIYVGDFGNNSGTRKDLMIYKISKEELHRQDEVVPATISFRYEEQTKYSRSNFHNFDCEAMIAKSDSLFLFTKNRGDFRTDVYGLPKMPGDYVIRAAGSFDTEGLVTGADYRPLNGHGELVLVGYTVHGKAFYPFIIHFPDVNDSRFFDGPFARKDFSTVLQTESIIFKGQEKVLITNEEEDGSKGFVYEVRLDTLKISHN